MASSRLAMLSHRRLVGRELLLLGVSSSDKSSHTSERDATRAIDSSFAFVSSFVFVVVFVLPS